MALDELKHFRKAAEKCFVSQPTISGQIKKLEEYLGVELIERTKQKVFLTEVGKRVIERARIILNEVNQIEEISKTSADPMSGKINIGIIPTLAPFFLPLIISPLKKKFPRLETVLFELQTAVIIEKLNKGELDLGILALPFDDIFLAEEKLFDEPFFMAVSKEHRLSKKKIVNFEDLSRETVLLLEEGHCLGQQSLEICYRAGAKEMKNFRATSMETLRNMLVVENNMVTLIPQLAVNHYKKLKEEYIKYIPFEKPHPKRTIGLIYRKSSCKKKCFTNIGELLKEIILTSIILSF